MSRALAVATVSKSLVFQAPTAWDVLNDRGYSLEFAAARDDYSHILDKWGSFRSVQMSRKAMGQNVAAMRQLRREFQGGYDFIQLQSPVAAAAARVAGGLRGTPSLYVAHGLHITKDFPLWKNLMFGAVEHALASRTSAIAVVSTEDLDLARALGWHKQALVWRLPGAGVDIAAFRGAAEKGVDGVPTQRTVMFCGELNRNKDFLFAANIAKELRRAGVIDRFVVVGDGPMRRTAEELANFEWCEYRPFSDAMPDEFARAHLLLHTSYREGLPRVIIEAMASGVPVLARSNRGSRELVSADAGVVLAPNEPLASWIDAAKLLLNDAWDSDASVRASSRFSVEAFARSYLALLEAVESGTRSGLVDGTGS
jgi:glycosyltransferase involved in cell wall biosynthesis